MKPFKNWLNLIDESNDRELPEIPAEYWYLQLIEITVKLEDDYFLVLEYPFYSYSDIVHNHIRECIWSPPYFATKMDLGSKKFRRVGQIKDEYRHFEEDKKQLLKEMLDYKLYTMGIGDYSITENGDILEYKMSFREPNKWKCYYIKRLGLNNLDSFSLYNIIDPECLKGYSYLNIAHSNELVRHSADNVAFFKGKPLASNTTYLFLADKIDTLLSNPNLVTKDFLTYKETGLVLSLDLIAFGKNQEIVSDTYKTFDTMGKEIADNFEFLLNSIFATALYSHNYNQFRLMGDGFIAASPLRHNLRFGGITENAVVEEQMRTTFTMLRLIFRMIEEKAFNLPQIFSCRCSLLYDEYYFGKLGGLVSDRADIGGRSVLKCQRLQGVIDSWLSEKKEQRPNNIYFAVEKGFYEKFQTTFNEIEFDSIVEFSGAYKEFHSTVMILRMDLK